MFRFRRSYFGTDELLNTLQRNDEGIDGKLRKQTKPNNHCSQTAVTSAPQRRASPTAGASVSIPVAKAPAKVNADRRPRTR
jgi:hypothetical protein